MNIDSDANPPSGLNINNTEKILQQYKVNQSNLIKLEHHIMDVTDEFKSKIREIQLQTEIQIMNTILDHYEPIFKTCCERSQSLILEEHVNTQPNIVHQV